MNGLDLRKEKAFLKKCVDFSEATNATVSYLFMLAMHPVILTCTLSLSPLSINEMDN